MNLLSWLALPWTVVGALVFSATGPATGPATCPQDDPTADPSLYCIDLIPTPDWMDVRAALQLRPAPSAFDIAATPDGHLVFAPELCAAGLPSVSRFRARAYVAWAATQNMERIERLGTIKNGCTRLAPISMDVFTILVSAERDPAATERSGTLIVRGRSPSWLMHPHDASRLPSTVAQEAHAMHGAWRMVPHHPASPWMIAGLETLMPSVRPWMPEDLASVDTRAPARPRSTRTLADGDTVALAVRAVRDTLSGHAIVRYAYDGELPGPLLRVRQGSTVHLRVTNALPQPTTIHWHGLRLDQASDGVPGHPAPPLAPGATFVYTLRFPDVGTFWYHPHVREDVQQDLGLAGTIVVSPARGPRPPREEVLILDDLLADAAGPFPYGDEAPTQALMGRFGNRFLTNGREGTRIALVAGAVIRLHLLNAASARPMNLSIPGARMKLVALDAGPVARERFVDNVVLAPAERAVVDVVAPRGGAYALVNRVRAINHLAAGFVSEDDTLAAFDAAPPSATSRTPDTFATLRTNAATARAIAATLAAAPAVPDHDLILTNRVRGLPFGLEQMMRLDTGYVHPVEWTSTMPMMDVLATGREATWILRDAATGAENMAIDWRAPAGRPLRIRLRNDRHVLHAMAHPMHLHGARFLVVRRNGVAVAPIGWKDTVLVPVGGSVEIIVDTTNPGSWMLHCHIAEHLESGMHMMLTLHEGRHTQ